jgi:hypothetical protein
LGAGLRRTGGEPVILESLHLPVNVLITSCGAIHQKRNKTRFNTNDKPLAEAIEALRVKVTAWNK